MTASQNSPIQNHQVAASENTSGTGMVRKKLSQAEINKAIKLHQDYRNGVFGGRRAIFSFHDLEGMMFAGADLSDADFTGAALYGASLGGCNLDRAILFGADLRNANLAGASMVRADLRGALLQGANLTQANLYDA